jgi:hypothetical protein
MPGSVATGFGRGDEVTGADWKIAPEESPMWSSIFFDTIGAACRARRTAALKPRKGNSGSKRL